MGETRPGRVLETALRDAITAGRLPVGRRLPPTRSLAADLGIARVTVSDVYAQLTAEGWLEARVGSGTWVADSAEAGRVDAGPGPAAVPACPAAGRQLTPMYAGLADPSRFPRREWLAAARRAVDSATMAELGYPDPRGAQRLRRELAALNQAALAEFFAVHAYDRHVRRMRAEYRRRRELLVAQLATRVPRARVTGVAAGLQCVVMLPGDADPENVVAEGLRRGLSFRTLADYAADPGRPHPPAIVLGYGASPAARARADIGLAVKAIEAGTAAHAIAPIDAPHGP